MRQHSVVYFGTYETQYPRNVLLIRKLIDDGCRVSICSVPLLDAFEHKADILKKPLLLMQLGLRAVYCYVRLIGTLLLKHRSADEILVGYIGHLDTLIVWPFAKIMRKTLRFNAFFSLYDTMVLDRKSFRPGSLVGRILWTVDYLSFHAADLLIMDTEAHKQFISEEFSVPGERIEVIPIDAEPQFRQLQVEKLPEDRDKFVMLFLGKFIPLQGIDVILRAMRIVQDNGAEQVVLRIAGDGQLYEEMRALAVELDLQNVEWMGWIPYEEMPTVINRVDLCLGIFGSSGKAGRVVPNKVWQCLRCGKRVITRKMSVPEKHPLFNNVVSVDHTPEALAEAIMDEASRASVAHPHATAGVLHSAL